MLNYCFHRQINSLITWRKISCYRVLWIHLTRASALPHHVICLSNVHKIKLEFVLLLRLSRMFARRRKPTYWDFSVNCTGTEAHLSSCKLGQILARKSNDTCAGGMPVVVSCVPGRAFAPAPMTGYRKAFRQEVTTATPQHSKVFSSLGVLR